MTEAGETISPTAPISTDGGRRTQPPRQPDVRYFLGWVYIGRLAVAAVAFLSVARAWGAAAPQVTLGVSLLALAALAFTAVSVWYTHVLQREIHRYLLYLQLVFDIVLVTVLVHLTGGSASVFASLYILVIVSAAVLLPFFGGLLIAGLASIVYLGSVLWSAQAALDIAVTLHLILFIIIAVVTGVLGDRLRQTGASLGEVETELEQLRMGTDEILHSIQSGLLTVDPEGRLAYINPAAERMLQLRQDDWLHVPVLEELDRRAPGLGQLIRHSAEQKRSIAGFETHGAALDLGILGGSTTVSSRDGMGVVVTAIFQDITEKRRGEVLRRRADRLEAVAELSASLAHEIRNPLASIRSAVEQLSGEGLDVDDREVLRGLVVRESGRLSRLLSDFLEFARLETGDLDDVVVNQVVKDVVALVRQHPEASDRGVEVISDLPDATCLVRGDQDLLHRALFNLLINAVQWAGDGGRARIEVSPVERQAYGEERPHSLVRILVQDTGPGISEEDQDGVFSPFYTTREGGTGLGLALVHRAMEAHHGAVLVDSGQSEDYPGASFELYIPAVTRALQTS